MAQAEIPILCYNFMAGTDWVRTAVDQPQRGGALVTRFDAKLAEQAVSLEQATRRLDVEPISAEQLWTNLEYFLQRIVPVAEQHGVTLAMHPDDPPLDKFLGRARIMLNDHLIRLTKEKNDINGLNRINW